MSLIREIVVFLKGDNSDVNAKIKEADARTKEFFDNLEQGSAKVGLLFTAIGAAVGGFLYKSVEAFSESEKAGAQLEAVLKSTGGAAGMTKEQLEDLATSMQKLTPYEDDAVKGAESMLLTFTNIKKDVFPDAIKTVLDMSTALGQDLKSSSIQLGKALNDPIKGVTALQRVGVSFTEQQKAQIQTLVESGRTMDAQKLILKELATEFGGSAQKQAETFAGKVAMLKNQFGDLMETVGQMVLPLLQRLMGFVTPLIQQIAQWVSAHEALAQKIVQFAALGAGILAVLGPILIALPSVISGFKIFASLLGVLGGPITLAVGALTLLYMAFRNNWLGIRDIALSVWTYLQGVFSNWRGVFNQTITYLNGLWLSFRQTVTSVIESIRQSFTQWYNEHSATINQFVANVKNVFLPIWDMVKETFIAAWAGIKSTWDEIRPYVIQTFQVLVQFIQVNLEQFMAFWNAHWDTIRAVLETVWKTIADIVKTAWNIVAGTIKLGLQVLTGDWSGAWETISGAFRNVWDGIKSYLVGMLDGIKGLWNDFTTWLENKIEYLLNKIPGVSKLTDFAGYLGSKLPSFAGGGVMPYTGMALVGEYGPELVRLPAGARVYNNSESRSMSNSTVNLGGITINTTGAVDPQVIAAEIAHAVQRKVGRRS